MATNTAALASRTEDPPVHHGLPARLYLALFAASLLLPALLFSIYLIDRASRQQTAMAEARVVQLAADLADDISGELERGVTILKSLALSGAMERGDYAELHAHAKRIIEDRFALLLLADKDGTQIVNTYVPFGAELARYGDPAALAHVVATGEPYVTDLFFGRTRQTWVVNILWPVKRGGEVHRVLVLSLTADTIHRILTSQFVEPGWTTGVSDRRRVLIARTRLHDAFVGKPLTPELVEAGQKLLTPHRITSVDGREIVRAVARTRLGHWTVAAAVDSSVISANVRRSVWDLMLAAAGLMLLSGAVVWVHGRKLAGAIMGLADPARSPAVVAAPVRELNQAAHIQAKALADLRERDEVLRLALSAAYAVAFTWDIPKDEVRRVFSSEPGLPATGNSADTFEAVVAAVHPDDRSSFRAAVEMALANPSELYRNEYRHIRASGEVCWLQEWGRVETD